MQLKQVLKALMFLTLVVCMITPSAYAQRGANRGAHAPKYDPKTEVTMKGTVEEVQHTMPAASPQGRGRMAGMDGIHLKLATEKGTLDVHLGPSRYFAEKKFMVNKGDAVEITGSLVKIQGNDALIAREITKDGQKLVLRNANGIPVWSELGSR